MKFVDFKTEDGYSMRTVIYTKEELRAAWASNGQGHREAIQANPDHCVIAKDIDEAVALELTARFLRMFNIPTCTHYNYTTRTWSAVCTHAGSGFRDLHRSAAHMVRRAMNTSLANEPPLFDDEVRA